MPHVTPLSSPVIRALGADNPADDLRESLRALRGALRDPLRPVRAYAESRARDNGSFCVSDAGRVMRVSTGSRLTPDDPTFLRVRLEGTKVGDGPAVYLDFPDSGGPEAVRLERDVHSPRAPIGYYNLGAARAALQAISTLCARALKSDTGLANRNRIEDLERRLAPLHTHLGRMAELRDRVPELALLEKAAAYAYDTRRQGDPHDLRFKLTLNRVHSAVDASAAVFSASERAAVAREFEDLRWDQAKWIEYTGGEAPRSYYLRGRR